MLKKAIRRNAKKIAMLIPQIRKIYYEREGLIACNEDVQQSFLDLASMFTPLRATEFKKIRIGRQGDGGYVMLDDFKHVFSALSFGIEKECSWDSDIAGLGIDIYQFDHTVEGPPVTNDRFHFYKKMIAAQSSEYTENLHGVLGYLKGSKDKVLLKCDIEGSEWEMFDNATIDDLNVFSQIVCEFHHFPKALDADWSERAHRVMKKLKSVFEVVHVHANNWDSILPIANVPFPEALEVTFANRRCYNFENNSQIFPTSLDFPNRADRIDIFLGDFKFL